MTTAQDPRQGVRRDVARFLALHEGCGSQVRLFRETGSSSGRVTIACAGCGERATYELGAAGAAETARDAAAAPRPTARRLTGAQLERWLPAPAALPWWVPNAYIAAVIVIGLGLAVFGLVGTGSDQRALFGGAVGPTEAPRATPGPPVAAATAQPAPPTRAAAPERPARPARELPTVSLLGRFEIGVPPGWLGGTRDGAILFASSGGGAQLRIFLEPGDRGPETLARAAADFLRAQHPGARLAPRQRLRVGGAPAVSVEARYEGGTETALLLSETGYEYLLLTQVTEGAGRRDRAMATIASHSFRAL